MPGYRTSFAREILHESRETITHLHSVEKWVGAAAIPTATHFGDEVEPGILPFQIDAGNLTWGNWVQLLGSDDTPIQAGKVKFDAHRIHIESAEKLAQYVVQIGAGVSGADALLNEAVTKFIINTNSPKDSGPVDVNILRILAGESVWARCYAQGENTGTLDFFIGIHEYDE